MFILARFPGESITIGDAIVLHVLKVKENGSIELGIKAPKEMLIDQHKRNNGVGNANPSLEQSPPNKGFLRRGARFIDWDSSH
ncbi:MAG: carbon storage regulator [Candidatus Moraniibacteriota bacterium]|nr:MAG: carbon storage regulator [Candidatus Moranbacteria bacterium]